MRRQRILMARTLITFRRQTKATEDAIAAADKSYALAEDTAKRQLRAYLSYRQARIFVEGDGKARAVIEMENTGQTPAYAAQGFGSAGVAVQVVQPGPPLMPLKSVAVIGAGKSFNFSLPIPQWSEQLLANLSQGISMYFVIGEFSYQDIFREKERTTKFQIGIGGKFVPLYLETEGGKSFYRMMTDAEGNEAD